MLSSELVRSALESAPDAIVIADGSGVIVFVNQQVSALFGYAPWELAGQNVEHLLPERFRQRHVGHREAFAADGRMRPMGVGLELFARRRDGSEFPVEISLSPIFDEGRTLVAAAIRDVSDHKRIEAELVAARESADRANQGKSRFLATASHDLRQPLQTLALLSGTLRRLARDPDSVEALARQEQAISAMSRLLNALLDISKLESGAIKPEPTDFTVAALFEELRAEFAGLAATKGLELQVEPCADRAHSDPSLVEQILRNLLSNAIKYTQAGRVAMRCRHDSHLIRIEVLDTGIGIPADQLPFIYDEFYQVGVATNSVRDGYGLGLSIVKRIARLLELRLAVESEVGKGSVFSLDLPPGTAGAPDRTAGSMRDGMGTAPRARAPHALIVEDDPAVLEATRMLLKVEGFRVSVARSLAEALQKAREQADIDVVITDYHLGNNETGTDVIAALRSLLGAHLGAVLVTGDTSSAVKELRHDERVRTTSKPIRAEDLLTLTRELLPL
ncbi:MAG TPA: PAS domain S-box protein [Steroidobacteraceae bacterium]|nr:PAS domain S-box protein [Steroidobacteraceae bacterium]